MLVSKIRPPPPLRGSRPPSTTQMNHSPRSDPSRAYRPNPTPIAPEPSCSRRQNLDGGTKGQQPCKCQSEQAGQNPKYDRPHPRGRPGRVSGGDGAILSVAFASPPRTLNRKGSLRKVTSGLNHTVSALTVRASWCGSQRTTQDSLLAAFDALQVGIGCRRSSCARLAACRHFHASRRDEDQSFYFDCDDRDFTSDRASPPVPEP